MIACMGCLLLNITLNKDKATSSSRCLATAEISLTHDTTQLSRQNSFHGCIPKLCCHTGWQKVWLSKKSLCNSFVTEDREHCRESLDGTAIDWGCYQKWESLEFISPFCYWLVLKCHGNPFCIPLAGKSDSSSACAVPDRRAEKNK